MVMLGFITYIFLYIFSSDTEFMAANYEDGSDTSEGSTGTGNLSAGVAGMAPLPVTRVSLSVYNF